MSSNKKLAIYTLSHLSIDMGCFYILYACFAKSGMGSGVFALGILLYNIIAFGLQPFIGLLADTKIRRFPIYALGAVFVLLGMCLCRFEWGALVSCALGNALFHAGAGREVLLESGGKAAPNGIFVSSGALGVALGIFLGKLAVHKSLPSALVFVFGIMLLFLDRADRCDLQPKVGSGNAAAALLCLFAIAVRALVGGYVLVPWENSGALVFISAACACLGKALGGVLGDRFSFRSIGTASQIIALVFIVVLGHIPLFMALGLVLFNMAMPLTLVGVYDGFGSYPGFSFGLTTLALLLGTLPVFFFVPGGGGRTALLLVSIALCAFVLYIAFGLGKEKK